MSKPRKKVVDPFYKSAAWFRVRGRVLKRDGYRCRNCGVDVRAKGMAHVHHVLPRQKFPELRLHEPNLETLCHPCHRALHYRGTLGKPTSKIGPDGFPVGSDWSK